MKARDTGRAVRIDGWQVTAMEGVDPRGLTRAVLDLEGEVARQGGRTIKDTGDTAVFFLPEGVDGFPLPLCVKRHRSRRLRTRARSWMRPSRGKRAWQASKALAESGVAAVKVVAVLETGRFGLVESSVTVTEWLSGFRSLRSFVKEGLTGGKKGRTGIGRRRFVEALAHFLKDLHVKGVDQYDLKGENILVRRQEDRGFKLTLIDLDRACVRDRVKRRRRMKNLVQLNDSLRDLSTDRERLRFAVIYHRGSPWEGEDIRNVIRHVEALTEQRVLERIRKGGDRTPDEE